ncbi:MAG: dihydrofolate reductase family protein [Vicinamibacteria bacterium]
MGKLIASMMTSLDGFIEARDRSLEWTVESADFNAYCDAMLDGADTLLFGRVSYEMMVAYWPAAEALPKDEWERRFARKMNAAPKVVLSRTLERVEWANTRIVSEHVAEEVGAIKARARRDCFVFGGARVIASLLEHGLIDEVRLIVHPVVLGGGTPLFADGPAFRLQPLDFQRFDSGVVRMSYGVGGRLAAAERSG